jgi:hypothetical protein
MDPIRITSRSTNPDTTYLARTSSGVLRAESRRRLRFRPGVWVPWILFVIWLVMTAWYPTMLLWWFGFMPIAFLGWHFGMNNTGKGS